MENNTGLNSHDRGIGRKGRISPVMRGRGCDIKEKTPSEKDMRNLNSRGRGVRSISPSHESYDTFSSDTPPRNQHFRHQDFNYATNNYRPPMTPRPNPHLVHPDDVEKSQRNVGMDPDQSADYSSTRWDSYLQDEQSYSSHRRSTRENYYGQTLPIHPNRPMHSDRAMHSTRQMYPNQQMYQNQQMHPNQQMHLNQRMGPNRRMHPNQQIDPNQRINPNQWMDSNQRIYPNRRMGPNHPLYPNNPNQRINPNQKMHPNHRMHPNRPFLQNKPDKYADLNLQSQDRVEHDFGSNQNLSCSRSASVSSLDSSSLCIDTNEISDVGKNQNEVEPICKSSVSTMQQSMKPHSLPVQDGTVRETSIPSQEKINPTNHNNKNINKVVKNKTQVDQNKSKVDTTINTEEPISTIEQLKRLDVGEPEIVILFLYKNNTFLEKIFDENTDPNLIMLSVRVLCKVCIAQTCYETKKILTKKILTKARQPAIIDKIVDFVDVLPFTKQKDILQDVEYFYDSIITVIATLSNKRNEAKVWRERLLKVEKSLKTTEENFNIVFNPNLMILILYLLDDFEHMEEEREMISHNYGF